MPHKTTNAYISSIPLDFEVKMEQQMLFVNYKFHSIELDFCFSIVAWKEINYTSLDTLLQRVTAGFADQQSHSNKSIQLMFRGNSPSSVSEQVIIHMCCSHVFRN